MITGKEFIQRLYSETVEEKLYSTGDKELDALLEKAFCEGYEYAQKEFAKKEDDEDVKLKFGDRLNKAVNYGLMGKKGYAHDKEASRLKQGKEGSKELTKYDKHDIIASGVGGAAIGAGLGALKGRLSREISVSTYNPTTGVSKSFVHTLPGKKKATVKGAVIGAIGTGAVMAGTAYLGQKLGKKLNKKIIEKNPGRKDDWEKQEDLLKLHDGEISKKDFVKKWGGKLNGKDIKGSMNK